MEICVFLIEMELAIAILKAKRISFPEVMLMRFAVSDET